MKQLYIAGVFHLRGDKRAVVQFSGSSLLFASSEEEIKKMAFTLLRAEEFDPEEDLVLIGTLTTELRLKAEPFEEAPFDLEEKEV